MIRFFLFLSMLCASAFAQTGLVWPKTAAELVSYNPAGLDRAILINTNGGGVYTYNATATDATNNTTPPSILKPNNYNGRWIAVCVVPGTTISGLQGAGADKVLTNNGTAWGITMRGPITNADNTASRLMMLDSGQRQTNSSIAVSSTAISPTATTDLGNPAQSFRTTYSQQLNSITFAERYCAADGVSDDTTALGTTAFNAVPTGGVLDLGGKTYAIASLSKTKSDFTIRNGTLKFISTNATGVVITGNRWTWDNVNIDGNSKAAGGLFINNNSTNWTLKNFIIQNIYGDAIAGNSTVAGITIRRGCQNGTIDNGIFFNITHATNGTRASRAIAITDFGSAGTIADQIRNIKISHCTSDTIMPSEFGDCIAINTLTNYSIGLIVSDCYFYNFGMRAGKVEGGGTSWIHNWVESYAGGVTGNGPYAGFSFYGPTNKCNLNTIIGGMNQGIEIGSYTSGFEGYDFEMIGNQIIFTSPYAQANSIGISLKERAYNIVGNANMVRGGLYGIRLYADVRNAQLGITTLTNQSSAGIATVSDGTNAPSNCDLGNLLIQAPSASYGHYVPVGTNINVGFAHGAVATSLYFRGAGVTGGRAMESDTANATAGGLVKFDSLLRGVNATPGSDGDYLSPAANEFGGFPLKTTPAFGDVLLTEDSAAAQAKKKITIGTLPISGLIDAAIGSTRGSILYRGAGGWAILAPSSTAGQVLASNGAGADPSYQTILGLPLDPDGLPIEDIDDLPGGVIGGRYGFASSNNGGTGAAAAVSGNFDGNHNGLWSVTTGTTATGNANIRGAQNNILFTASGKAQRLVMCVRSPSALSNGTDTYQVWSGFGDATTGANVDGAWVTYTHTLNSGNWTGQTSSGSTVTTVSGGSNVTFAINTYYWICIKWDGTTCKMWIATDSNGLPGTWTFIGSSTTNLPTSGSTGFVQMISKSLGTTAVTYYLDKFAYK